MLDQILRAAGFPQHWVVPQGLVGIWGRASPPSTTKICPGITKLSVTWAQPDERSWGY